LPKYLHFVIRNVPVFYQDPQGQQKGHGFKGSDGIQGFTEKAAKKNI
jgi:hypothetical protein